MSNHETARTDSAQPAKAGATAQPAAKDDLIRIRAYELYEKRDGAPGDPESDWYQAEAELEAKATEKGK